MRARRYTELDAWPGYVDALATLLMVIMFILMLFVMAQTYLDDALMGRTKDLQTLRHQLAEVGLALSRERHVNDQLNLTVDSLSQKMGAVSGKNKDLENQMENLYASQHAQGTKTQQLQDELQDTYRVVQGFKALLRRAYAALTPEVLPQDETPSEPLSLVEQEKQALAHMTTHINRALTKKVEELQHYRSEFFGKLKEALGTHPDIRVVGDRFVLQSEVLFASGSAQLGIEGQRQLAKIAKTLKELTPRIPQNIRWTLRVDGHTDTVPINGSLFKSNWDLSAARAISVVNFLITQGIAPQHLAAAGFGEFQPLEGNDETTPEAFRRNRRIELKLDQR